MNPNEEEYTKECPLCEGEGCDNCGHSGYVEIDRSEADDITESMLEDLRDKFR